MCSRVNDAIRAVWKLDFGFAYVLIQRAPMIFKTFFIIKSEFSKSTCSRENQTPSPDVSLHLQAAPLGPNRLSLVGQTHYVNLALLLMVII